MLGRIRKLPNIAKSFRSRGTLRRGVGAGKGSATVGFGFCLLLESLFAVDRSKQAMEIGSLRRKLNRFFQLRLRLGKPLQQGVGFSQFFVRFRYVRVNSNGLR